MQHSRESVHWIKSEMVQKGTLINLKIVHACTLHELRDVDKFKNIYILKNTANLMNNGGKKFAKKLLRYILLIKTKQNLLIKVFSIYLSKVIKKLMSNPSISNSHRLEDTVFLKNIEKV